MAMLYSLCFALAFGVASATVKCNSEDGDCIEQQQVTLLQGKYEMVTKRLAKDTWDGTSKCATDYDVTATTSVKADFYSFAGLPQPYPAQGDECPVPCDSTTYADTLYLSVLGGTPCTQWPGSSGYNAMNQGTCDYDQSSFSWDQYLSCDCGAGGFSPVIDQRGNSVDGTVPTHKTLYTNKCIVDTAKGASGICGQIVTYTACQPSHF